MNNDSLSDYPVEDILAAVFSEEEETSGAEETHLTFWSLTNGLLGGEPLKEDQLLHLNGCDECMRRTRRILARHCPDLSSVSALVKRQNAGRLLEVLRDHVSHCDRDCTPEVAQVLNATGANTGQAPQLKRLKASEWLHRAVKELLTSEYQQWLPAKAEVPVFLSGEAVTSGLTLSKAEFETILRGRWASAYDTAGPELVEGIIANSVETATAGGRSRDVDKAVRKLVEAIAIIRTAERVALFHMEQLGSWPKPAELATLLMETDAPRYVAPETLELIAKDVCSLLNARSAS